MQPQQHIQGQAGPTDHRPNNMLKQTHSILGVECAHVEVGQE